jgi:hypothetical protein
MRQGGASVQFLLKEKLWGLADPLLPATRIEVGDDQRASRLLAWIERAGAMPVRSGRYSRKPSVPPAFPISTRTVSGIRWLDWLDWLSMSAATMKS